MNTQKRQGGRGIKRKAAIGLTAVAMPLSMGGCDLTDFTATSTVTLDGREVVSYLVRSAILTPIQDFIDNAINQFFDEFEDENGN